MLKCSVSIRNLPPLLPQWMVHQNTPSSKTSTSGCRFSPSSESTITTTHKAGLETCKNLNQTQFVSNKHSAWKTKRSLIGFCCRFCSGRPGLHLVWPARPFPISFFLFSLLGPQSLSSRRAAAAHIYSLRITLCHGARRPHYDHPFMKRS